MITRTALIDHLEAVFTSGPAGRDTLLAHAVASHARPEIVTVIEGLPDKTYTSPRELWYDLPDLPV